MPRIYLCLVLKFTQLCNCVIVHNCVIVFLLKWMTQVYQLHQITVKEPMEFLDNSDVDTSDVEDVVEEYERMIIQCFFFIYD